mgnify:CR=1 FL=1
MLRRKPDSALIWYETSRITVCWRRTTGRCAPAHGRYGVPMNTRWSVSTPSLKARESLLGTMTASRSCIFGQGWAFPSGGSGKAGVFCGSLFCCLNYDTQAVELYSGSALLGSYNQEIARTASADLRDNPIHVHGGDAYPREPGAGVFRLLLHPALYGSGQRTLQELCGYRSDNTTVCELLRLGMPGHMSV